MRTIIPILALAIGAAVSIPAFAAQVSDAEAIAIAKPQELVVSADIDAVARADILKPVDAFYGFWNNGSAALLSAALSTTFIDHTLPPGRPQGPTGSAAAANGFLVAVPDLHCIVVQRLVVGDRVGSHLRFTRHFTGAFMGKQGHGETIDFIATDILRVRASKVTDNWHLEDNLAFMQQIGIVAG